MKTKHHRQSVYHLIISLTFVAIGIFLLNKNAMVAWATILFFGFGVAVLGYQLITQYRFSSQREKTVALTFPQQIVIEKIVSVDVEILEEWVRKCNKEYQPFHGVNAVKIEDTNFQWYVYFSAGELIRNAPFEAVLSESIYTSLSEIDGVKEVHREDTEVFIVDGDVCGEVLVETAAKAIDTFMVARLSQWLESNS